MINIIKKARFEWCAKGNPEQLLRVAQIIEYKEIIKLQKLSSNFIRNKTDKTKDEFYNELNDVVKHINIKYKKELRHAGFDNVLNSGEIGENLDD